MSLLTQILGGLAGNVLGGRGGQRRGEGLSPVLVALLPVVLNMLSRRARQGGGSAGGQGGGIGDLIDRFTNKGYGRQADSWVGTGANEALPPQAIDEVFGPDQLHQIAQQAGIGDDEARSGLSELLPDVVDHFTPGGSMPEGEQLSASVDDYLRQLS
jgi:uncharacterized protein YidB (DUF937 family)